MKPYFSAVLFALHICVVLHAKDDKLGIKKIRKTLKTKNCRYVFVVKEMDTLGCPKEVTSQSPSESSSVPQDFRNDMYLRNPQHLIGSNSNSNSNYIEELSNRLQMMEQQLDDEKQKNSNLNVTISKQEMTLQNMYKFINSMKTDQHKQDQKYRDLEKKFISMELDVAEVNNVLAKKGTLSEVVLGDTKKEIPVQSAVKSHNCATTEPDATFRGKSNKSF